MGVDSEDVDGSPDGLIAAVESARSAAADAIDTDSRWVLMIDGYERLLGLDSWVRDRLVASLPAQVVVVIAGRHSPTPAWRTDPGWRSVVACWSLDPLDRAQSERLLEHAGVPQTHRHRLAELGRGHPLTLAMLADSALSGNLPEGLPDAPDLVAALATRLVDEAPDDDHALAMALCAHAWLTTQDRVDELLGRPAPEVWAWLETRPWVTRGTYGIYPHDLIRDVLDADLRRRSPATYRRVHRAIHDHSWTALRSADEVERRLWAHQKLLLHRRSPLAPSFWTLADRGTGLVAAGRASDHAEVLELVHRFQGPNSAALARRWLESQPENLAVVRTGSTIDAFAFNAMYPAQPVPIEDDPVMRTAVEFVARTSPTRPGESISMGRFFGGRWEQQRDPYAVVVGSVSSTMQWTTQPLAWSFVATTDPEFWGPIFAYLALTTQLSTEYDGLGFTLFGIDWRRLTPERWFDLLGERELTGESGPPPARLLRPGPLSRDRFDVAVRAALRDLGRPDLLGGNDLMGSRLAMDLDTSSPNQLQASMTAAIAQLRTDARSEPLARVLDRTYVHPAPTQEAAAAVLDLPFSTYRRHLGRALEQLTELLWAVEIGTARLRIGTSAGVGASAGIGVSRK